MAAMRLDLIGRYLRPHRRTVIFGAIALVVVNVLSVTIPMEVRRVIDELQVGFAYDRVLNQAAWIVLLATTMGAVRLLSRQLVFGVGRQVEVELRQRLFDHMLRAGTVLGADHRQWGCDQPRHQRCGEHPPFAGVCGPEPDQHPAGLQPDAAGHVDDRPLVDAGCHWSLSRDAAQVRLFGGRMMKQQRRQQEDLSGLSDLIQEDLSGIGAIKIYGQAPSEQQAFAQRNRSYRNSAIRLARPRSTLFPLLEGIVLHLSAVAARPGQRQAQHGASAPAGSSRSSSCSSWSSPRRCSAFTFNTFQTGQVSLERVEELLQRQPSIRDGNEPIAAEQQRRGRLEARGLSVRYEGAERDTLNGIELLH